MTTVIVLATSTQECEIEGPQAKSCGFVPEVRVKDRLVVATATADCTVPPDIHDFVLRLQLLDNHARWDTLGKDESVEIPKPGHDVTLKVRRICVPGRWRAKATATGVLGYDNFRFTDQDVKEVRKDECQRREQG